MGYMGVVQRPRNVTTIREVMDYVYQLEEQVRHAIYALEQGGAEKKSTGKTEITAQMVRADQMATIDSQRIAVQNAQTSARSAATRAEESQQAAAAAADTAQGVAHIMAVYAVNISNLEGDMQEAQTTDEDHETRIAGLENWRGTVDAETLPQRTADLEEDFSALQAALTALEARVAALEGNGEGGETP